MSGSSSREWRDIKDVALSVSWRSAAAIIPTGSQHELMNAIKSLNA